MAKRLGIDLGSSSIGWFLRDGALVLKNGVITFNSGMTKDKSGGYTSPTKDRREARSKRRLIQARKYRKWKLLKILVKNDFVPLTEKELENWSKYKKGQIRKFPENLNFQKWLACDFTYTGEVKYKNPYELRVSALDNKLTNHELGRILYHMVQRRGYKDIGEQDKETKTQIERRGESGFDSAMNVSRTIGEALKNNFLDEGKRARNEYPYRVEYEIELIKILKAQGFNVKENDKQVYEDKFIEEIRKAIIWQRPLQRQKGNIGKCSLESSKPRCPSSHPIFEIFRTWQYINTIRTVEYIDGKYKKTEDIPLKFKESLFEDVFLKQDKNFKFDKIQKYLDKLFQKKNEYNYFNKSTQKYDSSVSGMPVCKGLISLFGDKVKSEINQLHTYDIGNKDHKIVANYSVYDLWHLIFETDKDHLESFAINKLKIKSVTEKNKRGKEYTKNTVVNFKNTAFSASYSNLSLKAMCKIIPFLKEGFLYHDAVLLAKIPECINDWESNKNLIYKILSKGNSDYNFSKEVIYITNGLIDKYKALVDDLKTGRIDNIYAYNDYEYVLQDDDRKQVEVACERFYGVKTWEQKENKEDVINKVIEQYQKFFFDTKREYRKIQPLKDILKEQFEKYGIELHGELYHHSDRENIYPKPIYNNKFHKELLAVPLIDSIKNPMFNKAMNVLRKLINELLVQEYEDEEGVVQSYIDENTEIIIEVARELNDNNKRIAIERYQRERRNEREKYRNFINELKGGEEKNIENDISKFAMWAEQLSDNPIENKKYHTKKHEILAEKDDIKRYHLWMEQKGVCMYTGKPINITNLFSREIEIEHTIPRSLLPDNTMANLTVCYSKYNSDIKNNRIPKECPNYFEEKSLPVIGTCTAIATRLEKWQKLRDYYKGIYESYLKPKAGEDEKNKNTRIQNKHYYKMHFDYWKDKVDRFTADEIKESWVRRQLVDTQMVSKYAREFLKTYFKKVLVQKGSTTADFRKIFGVQGEEKKDRSKHTHHSIDAAVLTLIPTNSSKRVQLLEELYREEEHKLKITQKVPDGFYNFNSQALINRIENETLIVNYEKDKITEQTYRNVRKRGKLQYLKDEIGDYIKDNKGNKVLLKSKGASIRGNLFKSTYIGKIRNVERDENDKPVRKNGEWKYLQGNEEFTYVKRELIEKVKIQDVIDPTIKALIKEQLNRGVNIRDIRDHQGNRIRHIRVKTNTGRKVKKRINYKSKHDYKNAFYSKAGEMPYAVFITNLVKGRPERKMIPIPIHEVAQTFKEYYKFTPELYMQEFHPEITECDDMKLLKVGQKVFVLKGDSEYEYRKDIVFQMNRMYRITQFEESSIRLKYHLEAREVNAIKQGVKNIKSKIVSIKEKELGLPQVVEDECIEDMRKRHKDFEDRMYRLSSLNDFRLNRLKEVIGEEKTKRMKETQLDKYKAFSSTVEIEGQTPLLKTSKNNWNFLFEGYDFEIDITGTIKWFD